MIEIKNNTTIVDRLKKISMKEIIDKYPDKVIEVVDKKRTSVLVLDTCKIIFTK
ncbi:MAG: hypothetical protein H8E55_50700 [Pelagibacterales bacterium]|nr:hypothetical protein [Pelagibacterales bacterium]